MFPFFHQHERGDAPYATPRHPERSEAKPSGVEGSQISDEDSSLAALTQNDKRARARNNEDLSAQPDHADAEFHHHHSHGGHAHHEHGHHLLQVEDLSIGFTMYEQTGRFTSRRVESRVIDHLNISVHVGEILALVGASGSGKTLLADAVMGLYEPNVRVQGTICYDGELQTAKSLAALRGRQIAFVPQSVKSLDPLMKVGRQIGGDAQERRALLEKYHLDASVEELYPHELSGGMARRVLLACALMGNPRLVIADEPTPGLDLELAVQAMGDFRAFADGGGGVLLITHDIELALSVADRIAVFKDGAVVEETAVENFASPELLHDEFSRQLWHALPDHDFDAAADAGVAAGEEACEMAAAAAKAKGVGR